MIAIIVALAACSKVGKSSPPDLKVVSGVAGVPESENPLSLDQLWNPVDVDQSALFDFNLLPIDPDCSELPSRSGKNCFWAKDPDRHAAEIILHTFSTKISYKEMKGRANFQDFRPTTVDGQPATYYTVRGESEESVCNIGWGTPTGTTWVSAQRTGLEEGLQLCTTVRNWANSVYPYPRGEASTPKPGTPWRPDSLNTPEFLARNMLVDIRSGDEPEGPKGCATYSDYIRSCSWELDTEKAGMRGQYGVRVTSSTTPYNEFVHRRTTDYKDHRRATVNGVPALQYSAIPTTCNVAWRTSTGTAWARVSLNDDDPEEARDTCAIARRIASDAQRTSERQ